MSTPRILNADCLAALRDMPDASVDAVVTDPPYGLSNTRPDQVAETITQWASGDREYLPTGRGFMGHEWDGFVPPVAVWDECLRVLKPGGHLLAFAGSRTHDLMTLGIRLAGFEIRDSVAWLYGSGFPKSLDVSKAIDKGGALSRPRALEFTAWMRSTGITPKQINEAAGTATMGAHYVDTKVQPAIATAEIFDLLRPHLPEVPERIERLVAERTGIEWTDYVKRPAVGKHGSGITRGVSGARGGGEGGTITASHSDAAREWEGWGTALKPAFEPVTLARKPLTGTVAANVLEHGTGALNIDATRISASTSPGASRSSRGGSTSGTSPERGGDQTPRTASTPHPASSASSREDRNDPPASDGGRVMSCPRFPGSRADCPSSPCSCDEHAHSASAGARASARPRADALGPDALRGEGKCNQRSQSMPSSNGTAPHVENKGRWPANVVLDESQAEELDRQSGTRKSSGVYEGDGSRNEGHRSTSFAGGHRPNAMYADTGGASRFFYVAKAPKSERPVVDGVAHSTVKPVTLMRWLVRMVTPPGGTVLDPFAGSGTTLEAAMLEGFNVIGIEREADYLPLIRHRIERATTTLEGENHE